MERIEVIVTEQQMETIVEGWSVKRDILGELVYNDQNQEIGAIDDIIITPDNYVSFAIIGVGGFLGFAKHDVVIPVEQLQIVDGEFVLPGATKEELKRLPKFEYASEEEKRSH